MFEAFRQGADTISQSTRGLGLGLSIARYLVERHDGTIAVASEGRARGSSFTVTLPIACQPRVQQQMSENVAYRSSNSTVAIH